jgi:geranylgeranyl pyrophosphate synthase
MSGLAVGLETETARIRAKVCRRLAELVPEPKRGCYPGRLHHAMRHSLLAPGKRIRPVVTVLTAVSLGGDEARALDPACAIEMVHTASLILDDMPFMDNATLRRGQPANHRVYGEDTATLAAVALLNRAYGVVGEAAGLPNDLRVELVALLSAAVGCEGIIAGQEWDLHPGTELSDAESLASLHDHKTGALFVASAEMGARVAGITEDELQRIRTFAKNIGLAFQVLDDLTDVMSTEAECGKNVSADSGKVTFLSLLGAEKSRALIDEYVETAVSTLNPLQPAVRPLVQLALSMLASKQYHALHEVVEVAQ